MKITKSTVILLVFVLMLSIFVANVADLINVDNHILDDTLHYNGAKKEWLQPKFYNIGTSSDRLIWFLQVCVYPIFPFVYSYVVRTQFDQPLFIIVETFRYQIYI